MSYKKVQIYSLCRLYEACHQKPNKSDFANRKFDPVGVSADFWNSQSAECCAYRNWRSYCVERHRSRWCGGGPAAWFRGHLGDQIYVWPLLFELQWIRYIHRNPLKARLMKGLDQYLIRTMRSESLMRIGARIGLNRYSSVSRVVKRVNTKLQKDRTFKERLAEIKNIILKSQP